MLRLLPSSRKSAGLACISTSVVLLLVLVLAARGECTSIVAVLQNGKVVIAADSKRFEEFTGRSNQVCKIHVANSFVWTAAQVIQDTSSGWDLNAIVQRQANTNSPPSLKIRRLDQQLARSLPLEAEVLRTHNPSFFQRLLGGLPILEVLFIGLEGGELRASYRAYGIRTKNNKLEAFLGPDSGDCPGVMCKKTQWFVLGARVDADTYFSTHPNFRTQSVSLDTVKTLVESEIRDEPELVGPPVATAYIDPDGLHWVNQGLCGSKAKRPNR
jgi:hypothetical protein